MKEYIDKLKEIETLVELSIGTTMTEEKATDIYELTNDLMCKVKKLTIPAVVERSEQLKPLDADFTKALNDLAKSKAGNSPTKKRF